MDGFLCNENKEINSELILEDISMLEEEAKVEKFAKDGKKAFNKSKVKSLVDEGKAITKMIYSLSDEDFVEGKAFPHISRLIVRGASLYGLWLINPIVGILGFVTDRYLKKIHDISQRKRLHKYYESKLEYIEDKVGKVDDDKEKYKLIKMKNALRTNIKRIDATITNVE